MHPSDSEPQTASPEEVTRRLLVMKMASPEEEDDGERLVLSTELTGFS